MRGSPRFAGDFRLCQLTNESIFMNTDNIRDDLVKRFVTFGFERGRADAIKDQIADTAARNTLSSVCRNSNNITHADIGRPEVSDFYSASPTDDDITLVCSEQLVPRCRSSSCHSCS